MTHLVPVTNEATSRVLVGLGDSPLYRQAHPRVQGPLSRPLMRARDGVELRPFVGIERSELHLQEFQSG
ncbi:uncharacterized protein N7496_008983 [Penicillium cataractarum]|uniref:Uncharacterized protein n=1 Tax=Penicillium cataractarum TaxID=2100454 RepID=A0A9W9S432_9EURO|nr:uncharacterized protein N7496_008983 [Penicillium cataractarum]KAJ5369223.1 hypothetical protein N7496_008983 [Penicillium cataractarum]